MFEKYKFNFSSKKKYDKTYVKVTLEPHNLPML